MRLLCFLILVAVFWANSAMAQAPRPIPPGIKKADKLNSPADAFPPLPPQPRRSNPAELKREADELARLSQTIPGDIDQVAQGKLPKDLNEKLKRIGKLSKKIRSGVSQ